jgi:hypothetical protein
VPRVEEVQAARSPLEDTLVRAYRNVERQTSVDASILLQDLNLPRVGEK